LGKSYQLQSDWSSLKIDIVLTQIDDDDDDKKFVVAYATHSKNNIEALYGLYKSDYLEAIWTIVHFHSYLYVTNFYWL